MIGQPLDQGLGPHRTLRNGTNVHFPPAQVLLHLTDVFSFIKESIHFHPLGTPFLFPNTISTF